ncbi:MAG: hypothetical protein ACE37B_02130 [Ilumatobacter sp.]|jgi:hypothetical protein|uniref:hypothetical protein n=1 Tax=Ilumatobacter sp. TaxID=1967498 RepID=UPI00391CFA5F
MALLPYALRPAVIIRRKAIWGGVLGQSTFWKVVAVWVFGKGIIKKAVGKNPESLGTMRVGTNSFVNVINAAPMSKKDRKRQGITKQALVDRAVADVAKARPGKGIRVR